MSKGIFQSRSRASILSVLLLKDFRGSIRAVAKAAGCSPMEARRQLSGLEAGGVLQSEMLGAAKVYSVSQKCPFLEELAALVAKTAGFDIQIKSALEGIRGIDAAFIYGSCAAGEMRGKSDIDLFIIGAPDMEKLNSALFKLQRKLGREISIAVYPSAEFEKRRHSGFIKNVLAHKKIMLVGDESELG